ncbi:MAG: efflux RND transporter permease subunit, partial [Planctomycetota bacterium]
RGMRADEAACEAATVLTIPMLTGTLTTVAAFFPMLIALQGSSREYIYSLPVTMTATLLISWFLAMTSCVILAAAFIKAPSASDFPAAPVEWPGYLLGMFARRGKPVPEAADGKKTRGPILTAYHRTASVAIKFKFVTVAIACGVLYWTLTLPVSSEFFPQDKKDQFYVTIATPETSTIRETDAKVREIERIIQTLSTTEDADGNKVERLRTMRSITGDGGARWTSGVDPNNPEPSLSQILIRTHGAAYTESYIRDLRRIVVEGDEGLGIAPVTGARVTTKRVVMGPPADPLTIRVYGEGFADIGQLRQIADEVKAVVRAQPETWDVRDSWGIDGLQLFVDVDEDQANLAGVTNAEIADTMNSYYSGLRLTTFLEGDHQVPVYFRIAEAERRDLGGLQTLFVEGQNGKLPLNSVATVRPRWEPARIERRDLSRMIEVSSEIFDGYQGNDVVSRVMASEEIKEIEARMPPGFRLEIGGSYEESADAGAQMGNSLGTSILLIIMILVIQYNGWSKTLLVLSTLPLALTGAFYGLWVTESVLGFMPQLGLLSLFGIVLNTGIIFIEFADILIAKKAEEATEGPICGLTVDEFRECLADAGAQRLLPIFLTTATTVGGLLPLALSGGPLWEGMSWLMIFGLLVATVMTLYVLPALYAIFVETFRIKPVEVAPADAS